jgi:hypothetical protein
VKYHEKNQANRACEVTKDTFSKKCIIDYNYSLSPLQGIPIVIDLMKGILKKKTSVNR